MTGRLSLVGLLAFAAAVVVLLLTAERAPHYPLGECTQWAYAQRPDLTHGTSGLAAADWESWARDHGYRVDTRPQVGDIAVWDRNIGAGSDGHVAYVEAVTASGDVFVSERNIEGCRDPAFVRLSPERLSTALFIHRRAA